MLSFSNNILRGLTSFGLEGAFPSSGVVPKTYTARPDDWPVLPIVSTGKQKFVGLYAVYNAVGQYVALMVSGNYIVDWGDGSSPENVSAGVKAQHEYSYATCGGAICSRGYKAVVISVTPQSGQNITSLSLDQRHSSDVSSAGSQWLDITICSRYMTSLVFRGAVTPTIMERVYIIDHAVTDMSYMFESCRSLTSVPLFNTSLATNMGSMFSVCTSLTSVPLFDTGLVTDMNYMFSDCTSLTSVPAFDTGLVTNMNGMFYSCSLLTSVPLFDTGLVTNMDGMFAFCSSLTSVPAFNTGLVTNTGSMFYNCWSLTSNLMTRTKVDVSVAGEQLSASALNTLFTNLGTVSGKTITITGNPGAGTCTQSIATGKGWSVAN